MGVSKKEITLRNLEREYHKKIIRAMLEKHGVALEAFLHGRGTIFAPIDNQDLTDEQENYLAGLQEGYGRATSVIEEAH